jgi:hypothetical protein
MCANRMGDEKTHLPIILLTSEDWNPSQEVLRNGDLSREFKEMWTIQPLTSGMTRRQVNAIREEEAQGGRLEDNWVQSARHDIELQHGMIPCTLNPGISLSGSYRPAYCGDIDQWSDKRKASRTILNLSSPDDPIITKYMEERKASSIVSNERHSIATPEYLAQLWNIGIQPAKETVRVTTQKGIRTAIHPMTTRRVRVDRLHLQCDFSR